MNLLRMHSNLCMSLSLTWVAGMGTSHSWGGHSGKHPAALMRLWLTTE